MSTDDPQYNSGNTPYHKKSLLDLITKVFGVKPPTKRTASNRRKKARQNARKGLTK